VQYIHTKTEREETAKKTKRKKERKEERRERTREREKERERERERDYTIFISFHTQQTKTCKTNM